MHLIRRPALALAILCLLSGCATNSDLRMVRAEIDAKLSAVEEKVSAQQTESAALRKEIEKLNESVVSLRKAEAELRADMTDIRDQIRQVRGLTEGLQKDLTTLQSRSGDYKDFKDRLDQAYFKVNYIENFLGISKKDDRPDGGKSGSKNGASKAKGDKEGLYAQAYDSFKEGKYDKARTEFQNFLKAYPDTEYSSNAQFWIGECYYFEKKYEKAILEYDKVIKNYPDGNKVPYALLRQGISFLNMGDKASAKAILRNIIKDYPNTNQARTARAKLLEIK
ncbi:MAG: Cell division coordinator CpoB [Syntrophus sp. SKADARSKE-3]|nr:Cell division coordinator CpoB [Syntrophus sp. SKADARSKE-3]